MKKFCLTLTLKNDPHLIQEYEEHHKAVWPEIINSIKNSGIENMEIYRYGIALFMIIEVRDDFSFDKKRESDEKNKKVQQWEELMLKYQQPFPETVNNEKWMLMNKIFELNKNI